MTERTITDIRVDRMRASKFKKDIKDRLTASGLVCTITVDGLLIDYPNGECCTLVVSNRRK